MDDDYEDGRNDENNDGNYKAISKKSNVLPLWGNERTMNLNPLILTNIQSSHYFKVNLYELKTYHEVIDEIYFKVSHLEPWEKGSRKTAGQTGMCGGVRGVGAGGIVSTAFCLLYKLFTLKLSRKQVIGLITHPDSPYIRVLGFMYIRYTQPPADLWDWYDEYLDDPEELDVKAGGGQVMAIGNILKNFLCKLEWFSTLFPRIPVPIQQKLEKKMSERYPPVGPVPKGLGGSAIPWNKTSDDYSRSERSHSKSSRSQERTDGRSHNDDDYRYSQERSRRMSNEDGRYGSHPGPSRDRSIDFRSDRNSRRRSRSNSGHIHQRTDDDRYRRHENDVSANRNNNSRRNDTDKYSNNGRRSGSRKRHLDDDGKRYRKEERRDDDYRRKHHSHSERRGKNEGDDYEERKHRKEIDDIIRHHKEKIRNKSSRENIDEKYDDGRRNHRQKYRERS